MWVGRTGCVFVRKRYSRGPRHTTWACKVLPFILTHCPLICVCVQKTDIVQYSLVLTVCHSVALFKTGTVRTQRGRDPVKLLWPFIKASRNRPANKLSCRNIKTTRIYFGIHEDAEEFKTRNPHPLLSRNFLNAVKFQHGRNVPYVFLQNICRPFLKRSAKGL